MPGSCCVSQPSPCFRGDPTRNDCCDVASQEDCDALLGAYTEGVFCFCVDCFEPTLKGACCQGADCQVLRPGDCAALGGRYAGDCVSCDEANCADDPAPSGCIERPADHFPTGRQWTADRCANARFQPQSGASRDGWELLSSGPTRAFPATAGDVTPSCAMQRADVTFEGGYDAVGLFCSNPTRSAPVWSFLRMGIAQEDAPGEPIIDFSQIERGTAYMIGSYETPLVTELLYKSHEVRCKVIV